MNYKEYFLEILLAQIKNEYDIQYNLPMTYDDFVVKRLNEIVKKICKESNEQ